MILQFVPIGAFALVTLHLCVDNSGPSSLTSPAKNGDRNVAATGNEEGNGGWTPPPQQT